jgi:hypothetical protein
MFFSFKKNIPKTITGNLVVSVTVFMVLIFVIARLVFYQHSAHAPETTTTTQILPSDVDHFLRNYHYSEVLPEGVFTVKGKLLVRRGVRLLGLRSTIAKTTLLDTIQGSYSSANKKMTFSALTAEWETASNVPLTLKSGIEVTLDRRKLIDIDSAKIYLATGKIITYGTKKRVYSFR